MSEEVSVISMTVQTWEDHHLFADEKQATLFLGALDSIFLFSYAVVSRMKAKQKVRPVLPMEAFHSKRRVFDDQHAGSVSERHHRGQSQPALRALLRPVRIRHSGECHEPHG